MDLPNPPDDPDLKNIIDKLANFVARNGPEFEQMTKQKQQDNPRFSFLFGGEHFHYYQYKVNTERAKSNAVVIGGLPGELLPQTVIAQQQEHSLVQQAQVIVPPPNIPPPSIATPPWQQVQQLQQQIGALQQSTQSHQTMMEVEISQSEQNLAAQHQSLIQTQQVQIEEAILKALDDKLVTMAKECEILMGDLDNTVQPIIESCTKDAILNGKSWIFQNISTDKHCNLIAEYLLKRITSKNAAFELKLHLIYLVNDLLHHCQRKNAENLKTSLEHVVVPLFCAACVDQEEGKRQKLTKLLNLWDQNGYFQPTTVEKMRDPALALSEYQASLITENGQIVTQITNNIQQQYLSLQKQHQEFAAHLQKQLESQQHQLTAMVQQQQQQPGNTVLPPSVTTVPSLTSMVQSDIPVPGGVGMTILPPEENIAPIAAVVSIIDTGMVPTTIIPSVTPPPSGSPFTQQPPMSQQPPPMSQQPPISQPLPMSQQPPAAGSLLPAGPGSQFGPGFQPPPSLGPGPPPPAFRGPPPFAGRGQGFPPEFSGAPPGAPPASAPNQFALPDLSKPPPGFPPPSVTPDIDLTPAVPYYELPAGLMAPLIKLEDGEYKSLNPQDIRLPPPMPPSDRLLAAVEAFYSPPSRERPRDSEGWEKLGLYEYFKAKQRAKKMKERDIDMGVRPRSRSPSPMQIPFTEADWGQYHSQSPPPPRPPFPFPEGPPFSFPEPDGNRFGDRNGSHFDEHDGAGFGERKRFVDRDRERSGERRWSRFSDREEDRFRNREEDRFRDRDEERIRNRVEDRFWDRERDEDRYAYRERDRDRNQEWERNRDQELLRVVDHPVDRPVDCPASISPSPPRRRRFEGGHRSRSKSRSRSRSNSRSRSKSGSGSSSESQSGSRSRSRSKSRSRSNSPLPYQRSSKSPSVRRKKSLSPRSPTPPMASFSVEPVAPPIDPEIQLGSDNKGHQLLKKMGWGGKGLGASEQGRTTPVSSGDVRDKQDMYKGIGMDMKDPFEQFRKNKSQGFVQRMKAREEAREAKAAALRKQVLND